ncbi:DUF2071 domain-containing protein [Streptomyces sp. NPDC046978]|uniref:DUF2071 domain-containing protein n=1 Tax=Streptomyces sp. NPDC046978 TaxID=3154704 RepID=UPI0033F04B96
MTSSCRRRHPAAAGPVGRAVVRTGRPIVEPTWLERFLTARWGPHMTWHGRTVRLPDEQEPWPLFRAELPDLDDGPVTAAGLPPMSRVRSACSAPPGSPFGSAPLSSYRRCHPGPVDTGAATAPAHGGPVADRAEVPRSPTGRGTSGTRCHRGGPDSPGLIRPRQAPDSPSRRSM